MKLIRKKSVYALLALVILSLVLPFSIGAASKTDNKFISIKEAAIAASYYVNEYSADQASWATAIIGDSPVTYYSMENRPIAYEFTILSQDGATSGYIIISATKDWMPVLEWSAGKPPSAFLNGSI